MDPTDPHPTSDGESRERWTEERTTFQRVYDVLVGTTEPETADAIADRAACSEAGARSALAQLVEMGVARKSQGRPARYRRNDAYLRWRRVEELADEHTADELQERVRELLERDEQLQNHYGVPDPDAVPAGPPDDHDAVHERLDDLREWRTLRRDLELLQRAITRAESLAGEEGDGVSV